MQGNNCRIGDVREGAPECERGFTKKAGLRYRVCFTIDIIAKGIGNASNFYGWAVYYPNYSTHPPHNGREVRAASRSCSTLDATLQLYRRVAAFIANRLSADSSVL